MSRAHAAPARALLRLENVAASYGRAEVLSDLSLSVGSAEAVVVLGRNGAGKSTTLKAIMGLEVERRGRILFDGREIQEMPPHRIAQAGIGYVPEDRRIFATLSVRENLAVARRRPSLDDKVWLEADVWQLFPPLEAIAERRAGFLSGGEQQMLAIARTLMGNPRLLLLDEPSEGLAPVIVDRIADAIGKLKARGIGLLVSEQNLGIVRSFADRVLVLETGSLRFAGTLREFDRNFSRLSQYLSV